MKRCLLSLSILISSLLTTSCGPSITSDNSELNSSPVVIESKSYTVSATPDYKYPTDNTSLPSSYDFPKGVTPPSNPNASWIYPGKVVVLDLHPLSEADWYIKIYNGNPIPTSYLVSARYPDVPTEGYLSVPTSFLPFVKVSKPTVVIESHSIETIPISVVIPANYKLPTKKFEFWLSVKEQGQRGFVQTETCTKWQITPK